MLMTAGTAAADEKQYLAGAGSVSCGKFLEDKEVFANLLDAEYFSWAQGFMSGLNYEFIMDSAETVTDLSDHEAQQISIENYCKENPLELYAAAIFNLWDELRDTQGLEPDVRFIPKD